MIRHGWASINVLVVSGYNLELYYLASDSPGSLHDSDVFLFSDLFEKLENEGWRPFEGALIGADSAYRGYYPWMVTPYINASIGDDEKKQRFNKSLCSARCAVERCIGVVKKRFPSLKYGLKLESVTMCAQVIPILFAIHNMIVRRQNESDNNVILDAMPEENAISQEEINQRENEYRAGQRCQTRDRIVQHYF